MSSIRSLVTQGVHRARSIGFLTLAFAATPCVVHAQTVQRPEEIVVTANLIATQLREIGASIGVLSASEIELRGYDSLADALRTQPGIAVTNSGGPGKNTVVRVRGEEHFRTLLVIDGVKALDASAPQIAPSFDQLLATADIERVEILRGPQGFLYGADAGGVVNVLTPRGAGPLQGRFGIEHGDFDTARYEGRLSGGNERGDYFVSGTTFSTDGFNSQVADSSGERDGADNTTLHAKFGLNVTDELRLQFVARDIDASASYDGCFVPATFASSHDCRVDTQQGTLKLSADYAVERVMHSVGYSAAELARDNFTAGALAFGARGDLDRLEYTGSFKAAASATFVYGAEAQREELHTDEHRERDQRAYYAEYQGRLGQRVFVSVGARYDDNEDFGSHTSTRASVSFVDDIGSGRSLRYRASVGTGFRAPSLYEISYNSGPLSFPPAAGVALNEETSRGYDLGVEYDTAGGLHLEATYFDQDIEDEIQFDLASFSGYLQTAGTSTSYGVELGAEIPLGERWQLRGNWTHNAADDTAGAQRLRRPKEFGNLAVVYRAVNERLQLIANYRLSRDAVDIGNTPLDDYEVLDLAMSFAASDTLEIFGRIENASDANYRELLGYNVAGRSAYAGVRFGF